MDEVTHTKHAFIQGTPHTHTLLSRIRDFFLALRTAAIRGSSAATRASAPCSLLCCSQLSQLLSWARLPSPSAGRHGCQPNLRLCCPSAACCTHARAEAARGRCRSRCRPRACERMGLSATAAAEAIARPRAGAARASSRPPARPAGSEERHRVSHGTRRRIGGGAGKACGSTGMAARL